MLYAGMRRQECGVALLLFVFLGVSVPPAFPQDPPPIRLAYVFSDGNLPGVLQAYKALREERPDLAERVSVTFLTESLFDGVDPADVAVADVVVLDIMNQEMLERFNTTHGVDLVADVSGQGMVLVVGQGLMPREQYVEQGAVWDERARAFWTHWGFANQLGLLKLTLSYAGVAGLEVPEPQPTLEAGYYYPDGATGRVFANWEEFDTWRDTAGVRRPGAPRVAVGFYKSTYYAGDTALLDAVITEIEHQGAEAIPVFGYPSAAAFEQLLLDENGEARADVAVAFVFRFANFEAAKLLENVDIPIVSLVSLYGRSEEEWRASPQGLSMFEGTFQVMVPELAGLVAPTVVGSQERTEDPDTGLTIVSRRPIWPRVRLSVQRALRYAALATTPNTDKRLALMVYNYPPGKASIGASYLNVAESLANILQRLDAEGYDVGDADLSADAVLAQLTAKARNVGGYAPGELDALLAEGTAVLIGLEQYRAWLSSYAPGLRERVLADWGPADQTTLMATSGPDGVASLVIPVVRYGNVIVLPQPARGWGEDAEALYHADDLAPHHQYVATYAWLKHDFEAHAVMHLGTHGTLEWLDGKDIGLSLEDAPDALIADLPNIYPYNVDVVGEGLVARRRGMATLVDHMVPPFKKGGLLPELAALSESINDYHGSLHNSAELARAFAEEIREQVIDLGIAKDLGLDFSAPDSVNHDSLHEIEDYLGDLRDQNIPFGLHAFGRTPAPEHRATTVEAILSTDRSMLPDDAEVFAEDMDRRIVESGPRELDRLMRGFRGGYVATGNGGEPIRTPDAYPTGKNFYGIDPDKVPKPAAWEMGVRLADQMLASHVEENGRYPEKVSFVIWGDETMRHQGVLESQIFHLLGTRPVWNVRGNVIDIEVVPSAALGRPRVDIVIASAAEGMFSNVTRLMDEAVQRVKLLDEAENYVRRHYLQTRSALIERGYDEDDADRRAGVRIFDEPPGTFNLNTSGIAAASGTWDTDQGMADEYLSKMGHGYGNGFWGEPMEDVFRMALSGTEKVVHSSSTTLYGALDNDDFFMYMGGLAAAVRRIDGTTPDMVVTNTRDPGNPEITGVDKFIGAEFRTRYVNPTWIQGMQGEGYAGAVEMRAFVEYLWGWDATVTDVVDDAMWNESFAVYVDDKHELGMKAFFETHSPFAYQDMTGRMIETIRKDYWNADPEILTRLLTEYVESVNTHGVGCSGHTCGNPRLLKYVLERSPDAEIPAAELDAFRVALEQALGIDIESAARAAEEFVQRNEAPRFTDLEGFRMTESVEAAVQPVPASGGADGAGWAGLWAALPLLGVLAAWSTWRRRRLTR